jgi:anaerobic selenocysteine-containing dehydrogenase
MSGKINRRNFLKIMGLGGVGTSLTGCDLPSYVTLEEGKENVVSYLMPEEYVIPGVGVWYASTCMQCAAGCGIHGRVREGRALKLEGNPDSALNQGKTCQMGQAGLQGHYNPDRLTEPMLRDGSKLLPVSWERAMEVLKEKTGTGMDGKKVAWFTGTVSGHQHALIANYLEVIGSDNHFAHEVVNAAVWQAVSKDLLGDSMPRLRLDKAKVVLSIGNDFLGGWLSPVHFAGEYARFRMPPERGTLIQAESKMTLTGANADFWVPVRPGTEGVLALGIANYILRKSQPDSVHIPDEVRKRIEEYDVGKVAQITGIAGDRIQRIGRVLMERAPSLVLAGASVEGHEHGYDAVSAVMLLNIILGNVGKTIEATGQQPFPQLYPKVGNTRDLIQFAKAVKENRFDVVFFYGANPVYTAPAEMGLTEALQNVPFKVAIAQFPDETAMQADLVLPAASYLEDWGSHIASYQAGKTTIGVQQPLMEKLHSDTKGLGDVLLALLKIHKPDEYAAFDDYYAYLQNAFAVMREAVNPQVDNKTFWNQTLQDGLLHVKSTDESLTPVAKYINLPQIADNPDYPFYLVPAPRMGLFDGRHANLPWLQESPDQITKVVWDSWAEIHPKTAKKLGINHGDVIRISSAQGSIETKAYLIKGIHPDAVAVPLGQGHEEYGRYARSRGVNPLKILTAVTDSKTGELAMYATRVKISKTGKQETIVRMGESDTQHGRRLVRTVSAKVIKRTEGA